MYNMMIFHILSSRQQSRRVQKKTLKFTLPKKRIEFIQLLLRQEKYPELIKLIQGISTFYYVDEEMITHLVNITDNHSTAYKCRLIRYITESTKMSV
jgi:hypothetical protein